MEAHYSPAESSIERAISQQLTDGHLTQMFELATLREKNRHAEAMERVKKRPQVTMLVIVAFLVFIIGLSWLAFAYGQGSLILPIVTTLVGLIGAAAGGYYYGSRKSAKDPDLNRPD